MRILAATLALASIAAAAPAAVTPAKADVYVAPAPGVYVYRRPFRPWLYTAVPAPAPVYATTVAPAYYGPYCTYRTVRTWVNGHYVVRRVRTCY